MNKQYTGDGETIGKIVTNGKIGDTLELAGLSFGMRYDKFKIAKLTSKNYIITSINREYTKDSIFLKIESEEGVPFAIIGNESTNTGLKFKL